VFVPPKVSRPSWRDHRRVIIMGAGLVLLFLFLAFNGMSRRPGRTTATSAKSTGASRSATDSSADSLAPILDLPRTPQDEGASNDAAAIERTIRQKSKNSVPPNLASVAPFEKNPWEPPPFVASQPAGVAASMPSSPQVKREETSLDKASLVFVAKTPISQSIHSLPMRSERQLQLPPGTKLRARLESAVNSATAAPVVAVVEYNYEQDGMIVMPAGAMLTGRLENADRSGYVQIRFNSLQLPDSPPSGIEALATDLEFGPLRGRVEGKHGGRNVLLRSAAGLGEVAATLVGRGSLNQPLSEEDLLRERVSNNIGQAADQQIANSAVSQHLVVSLPAGTEIYAVLEQRSEPLRPVPSVSAPNTAATKSIEELQQLLQLQKELTASVRPEDQ
jgi:type IV secretory pathway VirB10-like protein